ncbi:MAG: Arc family DNA-binding protein [Patescibacteria group bacterium]|nr:Arc family DNA-binding protein [Patescibacteria group bacterium]
MSMGARRLDKAGREAVLFQAWVPAALWERLAKVADENDRTITAEFVRRIRQSVEAEQRGAE